ncbi:TNT domain-containing protein [Cellulomonas sp. 179-A 9B4 NHS]|uniref:TNT domain-containing protein n=1 Tax=Cellulomonas sp. 179-A 9B4 NHS TaxID=3142379 RepID=UPI0039A1A8E8
MHSSNGSIVEPGYDPYGGHPDVQSFTQQYTVPDPSTPGGVGWDWPPNRGAVPGSEQIITLPPGRTMQFDRIGGEGGEYFSPPGTPFGDRALPPDRLNFQRWTCEVDPKSPLVTSGAVRIEESTIAPWFGQPGGGVQYRFLDPSGEPIPAWKLLDLKVLVDKEKA